MLDRSECLKALKIMNNGKSPGMDGYTAEFYKFFWNDLNEYWIKLKPYGLGQRYIQKKDYCQEKS